MGKSGLDKKSQTSSVTTHMQAVQHFLYILIINIIIVVVGVIVIIKIIVVIVVILILVLNLQGCRCHNKDFTYRVPQKKCPIA